MTTFIIGSKVNPAYPDIKPTNVIGINGAIFEIEKKFKNTSKLTMVMSPHIFVKDYDRLSNMYSNLPIKIDVKYLKNIRDNLKKKRFKK